MREETDENEKLVAKADNTANRLQKKRGNNIEKSPAQDV